MKNICKLICILTMFYSNIAYADIKFWTTEVQPARMAKQEEMAKSFEAKTGIKVEVIPICLLYTSPSPRDMRRSRMPSSA